MLISYWVRTKFEKAEVNKATIVKGNKPIVNCALLGPSILLVHVLGQSCATFYHLCMIF